MTRWMYGMREKETFKNDIEGFRLSNKSISGRHLMRREKLSDMASNTKPAMPTLNTQAEMSWR